MSNQSSYEGETQRLTDYSAPSETRSTARFDEALSAAPPAAAPSYHQPHRGRRSPAPLLGLLVLLIGLALLVNGGRLPISGGFVERSTTFADSYSAQELALDVGNGNVTLSRAAGDTIEVEAISHGYGWTPGAAERVAERIAPEITVAGDTLRIAENRFDGINLIGRQSYVEYHIALPERIVAELKLGSGDIEATGIAGALTLDTGSGDIALEAFSGELLASTGSGNIEVSDAEAAAVELQTGSGDVGFAGSLQADGAHSISTGSGNIELELPRNANLELSAGTGSGDINIDDAWPATVDENSASAQLGNGGAELELRTSSGDISVEAE